MLAAEVTKLEQKEMKTVGGGDDTKLIWDMAWRELTPDRGEDEKYWSQEKHLLDPILQDKSIRVDTVHTYSLGSVFQIGLKP